MRDQLVAGGLPRDHLPAGARAGLRPGQGRRSRSRREGSLRFHRASQAGRARSGRYERREYIALTPEGEKAGRRVFSRHRLLTRFFEEVLEHAGRGRQRAGLRHGAQPDRRGHGPHGALLRVPRRLSHRSSRVFASVRWCRSASATAARAVCRSGVRVCAKKKEFESMSLADVKPGKSAVVTKIDAVGALRQRLLDMGVLARNHHRHRARGARAAILSGCVARARAWRFADPRPIPFWSATPDDDTVDRRFDSMSTIDSPALPVAASDRDSGRSCRQPQLRQDLAVQRPDGGAAACGELSGGHGRTPHRPLRHRASCRRTSSICPAPTASAPFRPTSGSRRTS